MKAVKTKTPKSGPSDDVYQIKITLKGTKPPIWRRVLITKETTLHRLHKIIQITMGWEFAHMHAFDVGGVQYGEPDSELDFKDERKITIGQIAARNIAGFLYEYDFGDSWEHLITIEKMVPRDEKLSYPVCIKGVRACPPEDVGGVWGYEDFLEAIADPKHPDHEDMMDWIDADFDPVHFGLDAVNEELRNLR